MIKTSAEVLLSLIFGGISSDYQKKQERNKKALEKLELRFIEFPVAAGEISEKAAASVQSGWNFLIRKKGFTSLLTGVGAHTKQSLVSPATQGKRSVWTSALKRSPRQGQGQLGKLAKKLTLS